MEVVTDGLPLSSLSHYPLDSPLDQENVPSLLPRYLNPAIDGRLAIVESQVYPCINIAEDQLYQGMNNHILFGQFGEFPSLPNVQTSHEFSVATAEFDNGNAFSSEEIIKAAGAQYMHASADQGFNRNSSFAVAALSREEQNGLELAHLLLALAEAVGNEQYEQAFRLLSQCKKLSSQLGNPIQRLCYYFSEALQERIKSQTCSEPETGKRKTHDFANNFTSDYGKSELYALLSLCTRVHPYAETLQFTAVQAIIEAVGHTKRIHVIDLGIRTGCQWTALIQSLALGVSSSSVQHLKITAVGMNSYELEESGRRLTEFAKAMAIPFSYCSVKISKLDEINEGLFNVTAGEFIAVYAPTVFGSLLYDPALLGKTINVIKKLKPHILVNCEVEGQHNSPSFVNRFIEVLLYYSVYFDCLEVVLTDRNDLKRVKFEEVCCGNQISNMIACEGEDRRVRHVKMDMWRSFFRQAGFKEMSFSYQAWYQARLLLNQYNHAENFIIEPNGSAITVGWKGTHLHTLSLWSCKRINNR